ncbi:hypothetical protein [Bradyrhizobium sp. DASA03120]|uniref:hypothetical protein n=1 Tax=Bradyrhizobium sp. SMVTL-02 TaxID=3395917 RepID=UPI003F712556
MPVLIAAPLLRAHSLEFGFCFGRFFILAPHLENECLLLCEPSFPFGDIALHLPQFIVYRSLVHDDPRAAVLRIHRRVVFQKGISRAATFMTFNSEIFSNVPAAAAFSRPFIRR